MSLLKIPKPPALLLVISGFGANAYADPTLTDGVKGWTYGEADYKATPLEACKGMHVPSAMVFTHLAPYISNGVATGTTYSCHFTFPGTGSDYPYPTGLFCKSGYFPRWPGICVRARSLPPPSCSKDSKGASDGNPVMISTGVKVQREVDPLGPTFDISRTYRAVRNTVLQPTAGSVWSFSFERNFRVSGSDVHITAGDGSRVAFFQSWDGTYTPTAYEKHTLVSLDAERVEWAHASGGVVDYYKKTGGQYLLTASVSKDGQGMFYTYDAAGRVKTISDRFGRALNVEWGFSDAITSISGAGTTIHYAYDQEPWVSSEILPWTRRLVSVGIRDPRMGVTALHRAYLYENDEVAPRFYLLTGIIDGNGKRYATYKYDLDGRVLSSEHGDGMDMRRYAYHVGQTKVLDAAGAERVYGLERDGDDQRVASISQPGGAGCGPATKALTYTGEGLVASRTDFNQSKTCYSYERPRLRERYRIEGVPAAGVCPIFTPQVGPGQRMVSTKWHPDWDVETEIAEPLKITSFVYNGQRDLDGNILDCADGALLPNQKPVAVICKKIERATTDATGAKGFPATPTDIARIVSFTYNRFGQMLSETRFGRNPESGDTTRLSYYEDTTGTHTLGDLWKTVNAKGHVTEYLEYTPAGLPTKIKESNGQLTVIDYDERHQVVRRISAADTPHQAVTEFTYDRAGQITKTREADGTERQYTYDSAHRLVAIRDSAGNSIHYTLDGAGNRLHEEVSDAEGRLVRKVSTAYDPLNRVQAITEGGAQ